MLLPSRLHLAAVAVCLLALTAGCLGGLSDDGETADEIDEPAAADADDPADDDESAADEPSTEEIIDGLESYHKDVDTIQGTQAITTDDGDEVDRIVTAVIERPPVEQRQEIVESNDEQQSIGDVTVTDEDGFRFYDSEENTITETEGSTDPEEPTPFSAGELDESMISFAGTDTVADRETYLVEYSGGGVADDTMMLWLDQEYWYPLKQESSFEVNDQETTTVFEFEEVTFNEELPEDAFTLGAPDDAEVETIETPDIETYDSIEAAEAETGIEVPDHELPAAYELDSVQHTDGETEHLTIWYEGENSSIHVTIEPDIELPPTEEYEPVEIGDREGYANEFGEASSVAVECGDTIVSLFGSTDTDELIEVAETLDC